MATAVESHHARGDFFRFTAVFFVAVCLAAARGSPANAQGDVANRSVPRASYFLAMEELYDGQYRRAIRGMESESRGALRSTLSRWIDSICYHTMLGECYYQLGRNGQALDQYNAALKVYLAFPNWMVRVQFPATIQPAAAVGRRPVPWGQSTRQPQWGRFPDTMLSGQGRLNNNDVVQRGGVFQSPMFLPINVVEIVRCTCLAIRRRGELMGPVAAYDPLTDELVAALSQRPAAPNHWSQGWIDVQLGMAHAAAGTAVEAQKYLTRSLRVAGRYDHPLTPVALLELGRLAMAAGDWDSASRFLQEASYSAYYFEDLGVLEESFHYGQRVHLMARARGIYPPLVPAAGWAKSKRYRHLQVWLNLLAAENYAALGDARSAHGLLDEVAGLAARTEMAAGMAGGRSQYLKALVLLQQNRLEQANQALGSALEFLRARSKWQLQISLAIGRIESGTISARPASLLLERLLRDPNANDWAYDPSEALCVLTTPQDVAFQHWFDAVLNRDDVDHALEVADRTRRRRFFASLPLGGRLLALRRILESAPDTLPPDAALQRQELLGRYPHYETLAQRARSIRQTLAGQPLVATNEQAQRAQGELLQEWRTVSAQQEAILRVMALRRGPADIAFPPLRPLKEVQGDLPDGTALLVFFASSGRLHAWLATRGEYQHWRVESPGDVRTHVAALLRQVAELPSDPKLQSSALRERGWQKPGEKLYASLLQPSKLETDNGIRQLVIVPDGFLWYLPFEALPIGDGEEARPLIAKYPVRYAPTMGLAVASSTPRGGSAKTGIVAGRLFAGDDGAAAAFASERLSGVVPGPVPLRLPLRHPPQIRTLSDNLIVLDEIQMSGSDPYGWSPLPAKLRPRRGTLHDWWALPWGSPSTVMLPCLQTAAHRGPRAGGDAASGREVFLATCALMSGGTRTVLLGRWSTGGQTMIELVREFAQELPYTSAADAWQRSVLLAMEQPLDASAEPKLRAFTGEDPPAAAHPFFWSGQMLVDTGLPPQSDDDKE